MKKEIYAHSTDFEINKDIFETLKSRGWIDSSYGNDLVPSMIYYLEKDNSKGESEYLQIMFSNSTEDDYINELFNKSNLMYFNDVHDSIRNVYDLTLISSSDFETILKFTDIFINNKP